MCVRRMKGVLTSFVLDSLCSRCRNPGLDAAVGMDEEVKEKRDFKRNNGPRAEPVACPRCEAAEEREREKEMWRCKGEKASTKARERNVTERRLGEATRHRNEEADRSREQGTRKAVRRRR